MSAVLQKPSSPSLDILSRHAPEKAWGTALSEAIRSPMQGYQTGAVIISSGGDIISKGCSHPSLGGQMNSVHAERHALIEARHCDLRESICVIYTRSSRSGGSPWTSRPCISCAKALVKRGVRKAIYPVRDQKTGLWRVEVDEMRDVMNGVSTKNAFFARGLVRKK